MNKGDELPEFTYTVTGLVNDNAVITAPSMSTDANGKATGTFDITITGGVIENAESYDITYTNGILTVEEPLPATYTIIYNANGGSGSMENGTATEGVGFTLPSNRFAAPEGKRFKAWGIGSSTGPQVNEGATYIFTKDTTLYAIWEDIPVVTYIITLNTNGGSVITPDTFTTDANGKLTSFPIPSRDSRYRFDGWFTAATGGTQVTSSTVFSANTTIYAHWTYIGGSSDSGGNYPVPVQPNPPKQNTSTSKPVLYNTYRVKKGDSFWKISKKYNCNMYELAKINNKTIKDIIYPGEVLKIPKK